MNTGEEKKVKLEVEKTAKNRLKQQEKPGRPDRFKSCEQERSERVL
jgi:hypothetical protein